MPEPDGTSVVEHEVRVEAPPETVFSYFTDPAKLVSWMGAEATLDPRAGGICRLKMNEVVVMLGEFVEVEPHRRIVFTWGYEQELFSVPPQSTTVEVLFEPDGEGTWVRLYHRRLPDAPRVTAFHRGGWQHYFGRLAIAATGADPGPDPVGTFEAAIRAQRELERNLGTDR